MMRLPGKLLTALGDYLNAPVGSVSTGCWIYAGVTGKGNLASRRGTAKDSLVKSRFRLCLARKYSCPL